MEMPSSTNSGKLNRRAQGRLAEDRVAAWMVTQGYRIVAQNFYARPGEIDIIAAKDLVYAFVEVKSRSKAYVDQSRAITRAKQQSLVRAARTFAAIHRLHHTAILRFDVVFVGPAPQYTITYLPNAFTQMDDPF
jgi:putative endonuclease